MANYYHPDTDVFRKLGVPLPTATTHGTEDEIKEQMSKYKPTSWELQGNQLIGHTEMGKVVQTIPTDYICHGIDKKGLPILKKVSVQWRYL